MAVPLGEDDYAVASGAGVDSGAGEGAEARHRSPEEAMIEDDDQHQQATFAKSMAEPSTPQDTAANSGLGKDLDPPTDTLSSSAAATEAAAEAEALAAARNLSIPAVQVCVRLRPLLPWERSEGHESSSLDIKNGPEGSVTLRPREGAATDEPAKGRGFRFNAVFGPEQCQQDMWDMARIDALVGRVAAGFHATIFAYGQTGSGKTHTMEGYDYSHHNGAAAPSSGAGRSRAKVKSTAPDQLGVVPRAVQRLFVHAEALLAQRRSEGSLEETFSIKVSFLQIYKEKVFDLLNPSHTPAQREGGRGDEFAGLRIRWDATKRSFFAENLFEYECASAEEALQHFANGVRNKHVASTAMNVASSRSHTLLTLTLVRTIGAVASSEHHNKPLPAAREIVSKLALVDLAGSERTSASSSTAPSSSGDRGNARFHEAVNINQSLFVLRKVITALAKRSKATPLPSARGAHYDHHNRQTGDVHHIPYRESKLTSLLQHAIGGNSFLLMLACLSPSDKHYEENLSTLQYASQAACIKNEPIVNLDPKDRIIDSLKAQLLAAHRYILRMTGLEDLPEEVLVGAPPPGPKRSNRGHHQRTSTSVERPTPSAPSSARMACAQRTWSSECRSGQGSLTERGHNLANSKPSVLHLTTDSIVAEETVRPSSHTSSADAEAMPATPEDPSLGSTYPAADLLLAAGSAYRPSAFNAAAYRLPGRPPGFPGTVAATGTSAASTGPGASKSVRPPSIPSAAWSGTVGKDALPPISGTSGSIGCAGTPAKATVPSRAEGLAVYAADVQNAQGGNGWGSSANGRRRRRGGSQPARGHPTPRSESIEGCGDNQEQVCVGSPSESAAAAVDSGLWEALEELRVAKRGLEEKLKSAEMREGALKAQLQELSPRITDDDVSQQASDSIKVDTRSELASLLISENEALKRSITLLEERLESASLGCPADSPQVPAPPCHEEVAARDAEARALETKQETMRSENEVLRRERKELQERLEVFEQALKLESPKHGVVNMDELCQEGDSTQHNRKLGEKMEQLHSQFVLEVVGLRKEVAGLKKKKWVLRSVLASGGESERKAIENDVMELRKATGASCLTVKPAS